MVEEVKQTEAVRILSLLAARQPRPMVEEATIEGIHMLVILGDKVDTVIRYNRRGGADMPQLCTYPEVAEAAAHADERLAKQRASGRKNTTGEGVDWPRNWKLGEAQAAGTIWYARRKTERKVEPQNVVPEAQKELPPALLSVEEMNDPFLEAVGVNTEQVAMNESIKAAVQQRQNRVYSREEVGDERSRFRAEWARLIRDESKRYLKPSFSVMPSDAEHCQAIQRISDSLSARFGECLVNGRLRFGTSQKALNLYLKFVWRLGIAVAPPHCPVDGIVLSAAGIEGSWTRCDSEREYMDWIIWIREKARPLSLAEWEHQVWLRVAPSQWSSSTC